MKLKKEYLILFLVIAALALYLGFRDKGGSHADLPQPQALESQQIDRILVTGEDSSLDLVKKDDKWTLQPQDYPADPVQVTNMLNAITKLELTALASTSENYTPYGLSEDEKISVKAFSGTTLMREFYVGKVAPTYRHTYVLLAGDPDVYHAQGTFRNTFFTTVDDLRNKQVMTFDRSAVVNVEIQKGDLTLSAVKTETATEEKPASQGSPEEKPETVAPPKTQWQTANGDLLDSKAMGELLSSLSNLQCDGFINDRATGDFTSPLWTVTFKDADQTYTLSVFAKQKEDDQNQPATASTSPYVFTLPGSRVETLAEQVDKLLGIEKKEADTVSK